MLWEMGMLATFIEHYLVICNLFNGGSWENQTLEEENSSGQKYKGVRPKVNAHDSKNKQKKCYTLYIT